MNTKHTPAFIKDVEGLCSAERKLWKLKDGSYIATSYVCNGLAHETMAFRADETGEVTDWGDLACIRDMEAHERVARMAADYLGSEGKEVTNG